MTIMFIQWYLTSYEVYNLDSACIKSIGAVADERPKQPLENKLETKSNTHNDTTHFAQVLL